MKIKFLFVNWVVRMIKNALAPISMHYSAPEMLFYVEKCVDEMTCAIKVFTQHLSLSVDQLYLTNHWTKSLET